MSSSPGDIARNRRRVQRGALFAQPLFLSPAGRVLHASSLGITRVLNGEFQFPGHGSPPLQFRKNETGTRSASRSALGTNEICRTLLLRDPEPTAARGAARGNGEEGLIARKYDKADGKRFVETLENLYEAQGRA